MEPRTCSAGDRVNLSTQSRSRQARRPARSPGRLPRPRHPLPNVPAKRHAATTPKGTATTSLHGVQLTDEKEETRIPTASPTADPWALCKSRSPLSGLCLHRLLNSNRCAIKKRGEENAVLTCQLQGSQLLMSFPGTYFFRSNTVTLFPTGLITEFPSHVKFKFPHR